MFHSARRVPAFFVVTGLVLAVSANTAFAQATPNVGSPPSPAATPPAPGTGHPDREGEGILCAHAYADNPAWRTELSALIGERVDHYDTSTGTPTVSYLQQYRYVFTWSGGHHDMYAFGIVLANYVDAGGKVILGRHSYTGFRGATLTPAKIVTEAYCPVGVSTVYRGSYSWDPDDWTDHFGLIRSYWPRSTDRLELRDGASSDGEILGTGRPAIAWRSDRRVCYVAGVSGSDDPEIGSAKLIASIYHRNEALPGACCDPSDGTCEDDVEPEDCLPPLAFHEGESCLALDPPCGNIGCCCHGDFTRTVEFEADCDGRFEPGITGTECTESDPFGPPCVERTCSGILYAPTYYDYPTWRAELSEMIGAPVDYFDARNGTPTLEMLQQYCCVFTWAQVSYDDRMAFGSVLADYVDGGGQLILGERTYQRFGGGSGLVAEILDPAYCPITISTIASGTYAGDGVDCVHALMPVAGYSSPFTERMILRPGAQSDGTIVESGTPAVAWRPDRLVYYLAGNSGPVRSTGDTTAVIANAYLCTGSTVEGACCDPEWGDCIDGVDYADCQPPRVHHSLKTCDALDPPCGNPGCCCEDWFDMLYEEVESKCEGRFMPGILGEACWGEDPFWTSGCGPCAVLYFDSILYAPAGPDNPEWRAELQELTGSPVYYFDARIDTPYHTELRNYNAILTWADEPYHDAALFGERLAYMAHWNVAVVLGRGSWEHLGGFTPTPAEVLGPEYCPVVVDGQGGPDSYARDGTKCVHTRSASPVTSYASPHVDLVTLREGAKSDGTFINSGRPAVAWGRDQLFYYLPAFTGGIDTTGDMAELITNIIYCPYIEYGACCNPTDGTCVDDMQFEDCWPPLQYHFRRTCEELDPPCGNAGCCCDETTGLRTEEFEINCEGSFLPGVFGSECTESDPFDPPCGNPGCCCDENTGTRTEEFEVNCPSRFVAGATGPACTEQDPFDPPCGEWTCSGILYAPSNSDDANWRAELAAITGQAVDFWNARTATPTLEDLRGYCCVFTWTNYAYDNAELFGDVLADYVDDGGKVILGQWCSSSTAANHLAGRIMEADYCPATVDYYTSATYAGDGTDCVHVIGPVMEYHSDYVDVAAPRPGALTDGTFIETGSPAVIWRPYRHVYYAPGQTGTQYTEGASAQLIANICECEDGPLVGACCDPSTGTCEDDVAVAICDPPFDFYLDNTCALLDPPCGNPGCCCDDVAGTRAEEYEIDCAGRFIAGATGTECTEADPFSPPCGELHPCDHAITMWDDYGDGWNDGYIDVYVAGDLVLPSLTLEHGSGPKTVFFPAAQNEMITTVWVSGDYPYEASYCIYGGMDEELACDGLDELIPTGITLKGDCGPLGACCKDIEPYCVEDVPQASCPGVFLGADTTCGDDCDKDGVPDACQPAYTDITLFLDQLLAGTQDPVYVCMFDCNEDTALDGCDIQGFVNRLVTAP